MLRNRMIMIMMRISVISTIREMDGQTHRKIHRRTDKMQLRRTDRFIEKDRKTEKRRGSDSMIIEDKNQVERKSRKVG